MCSAIIVPDTALIRNQELEADVGPNDPEEGDAESNISMGTPFEDLPEDWVCPKCGAEKEFFEKLD